MQVWSSSWKTLISFLSLDKKDFVAVAIYGVLVGGLSLVLPLSVQSVVNQVAFGTFYESLFTLVFILIGGLTLSAFFRSQQVMVLELLQRRLLTRIASRLSETLPVSSAHFRSRQGMQERINQFAEIFALKKNLTGTLINALDALLMAFAGMVIMAFYHPWLLVLDIVILVSSFALLIPLGIGGTQTAIDESKEKYRIHAWLERVGRLGVGHIFNESQSYYQKQSDERIRTYLEARDAHFKIAYRQIRWSLYSGVLMNASVLVIGGILVLRNELSLGQLIAAEIIVNAVSSSMVKLGSKVESFYDSIASVDKLLELRLDAIPVDEHMDNSTETLSSFTIQRDHIRHKIQRGDIALIHGAETHVDVDVVNFFTRQFENSGEFWLGEHDRSDLSRAKYFRHVCILERNFEWDGALREAFHSVKPDISDTDVWRLLTMVHLDNRIRQLGLTLEDEVRLSPELFSDIEMLQLGLALALAMQPCLLVSIRFIDGLPFSLRQKILADVLRTNTHAWIILSDEPDILAKASIDITDAFQPTVEAEV